MADEIKEIYIGDKPYSAQKSGGGQWVDSLSEYGVGGMPFLEKLYDNFLAEQSSLVQLVFKRLGIFSFGGFGASADTEGGAPKFSDESPDPNFSRDDFQDDSLDKYLVIPINPEEIKVNYVVDVSNYKTIFFSEVAAITGIKLRRFRIDSFFPYSVGADVKSFGTGKVYSPKNYIDWITECMDNRVILAFKGFGDVASPLPYMTCFIESFETTLRADGEVGYSLSICEYVDYRQNVDIRQFVMDGNRLIVSEKPNERNDGKIGIGDFVKVVDGHIFSDFIKTHPATNRDISMRLFKRSPQDIAKSVLGDGSKSTNFLKADEYDNPVTHTVLDKDSMKWITEFVSSLQKPDSEEIWRVVGGDYFSDAHKIKDYTISKNWMDQLYSLDVYENYLFNDFALTDLMTTIKIQSMKDSRIGWVNLDQLEKVSFGNITL